MLCGAVGGFQGAEGSSDGGVWYVENVMEEVDFPREYFYDKVYCHRFDPL